MMQKTMEDKIQELMNANDKLTFCEFLDRLLADIEYPPKKLKRQFKVILEVVDKGAPHLWVEMPIGTYISKGVTETLHYETFVEATDSEEARNMGDKKIAEHINGRSEKN